MNNSFVSINRQYGPYMQINPNVLRINIFITTTYLVYIFLLFSSTQLFSQTYFQKTLGGASHDAGLCIKQTFDRGYIIGGVAASFGSGPDHFYLVKTDSSGNLMWTKTFGGTGNDDGHFVQQTSDSGYIFVGRSGSFGAGGDDIYLVKTDVSGNISWTKTFGGALSDDAYCVKQTSDGGYIIAGTTSNFGAGNLDVYLIKTDPSGNLTWTKTFGGPNDDFGYSVLLTSDGGYIISGATYSFGAGSADVYIIKTDNLGDTLWTKTFGGGLPDISYASEGIYPTSDKGYIICGETQSFGAGFNDIYLVKIDSLGNLIWSKAIGGIQDDWAYSVHQVSDGGFIIAGTTSSFGYTYSNAYFIKTDSSGNLLWSKAFGGSNYDEAGSFCETPDGGFLITGLTHSFGAGSEDLYLIKTDSNGNSVCSENPATIIISPPTQTSNTHTLVSSGCITTTPANTVGQGGTMAFVCSYTASLNVSSPLCNSECTGTASVITSGGTSPFTYKWNNGQSSATATGLCSGNYTITVTDASGLVTVTQTSITQPSAITLNTASTSSCTDHPTGTATVNATGGTSAYLFSWSSGQTTQSVTALSGGTYFVTVSDTNNCNDSDSVTVATLPPPTISITGNSTICSGQSTTLSTSGGGTYLWSTGDITSSISVLPPSSTSFYVTVTDINGCIGTSSKSITVNPIPTVNITGGGTIIQGMSIQLAANGTGTFLWTPSTGLSCSTCSNPITSPEIKTNYCVLLIDSNNCSNNACSEIDVICGDLFVPTAFSPNHDGQNDLLFVRGKCIQTMTFLIFNRWGEKVFETNNQSNGWDGTFKNLPCNPDVFEYYLSATLFDGSSVNKKGNVTLIR